MNAISLLVGLLAGAVIGAVIGYLYARERLSRATTELTAQARAADERARSAAEKASLLDGQLAERFQALSAQALDQSTRRFLEIAEGRLSAASARAAGDLDT